MPKSAPGRGEHVQLHRYFGHGKDRGVQGAHRRVRRRTFFWNLSILEENHSEIKDLKSLEISLFHVGKVFENGNFQLATNEHKYGQLTSLIGLDKESSTGALRVR